MRDLADVSMNLQPNWRASASPSVRGELLAGLGDLGLGASWKSLRGESSGEIGCRMETYDGNI